MGNEQPALEKRDSEAKAIVNYLKERNSVKNLTSSISTQSSVYSSEKRWQQELLSTLAEMAKQEKWQELSRDIRDIVKNIDQGMFIKAVTIINAIKSTELADIEVNKILKSKTFDNPRVSQFVFVEEGVKNPEELLGQNSPNKGVQKKSQETIRKQVGAVIRKELNQPYHPVNEIKESFMMMFQMKFRTIFDEKSWKTPEEKEQIYELMFQDIDFFCELVVKGCSLYRSWIIETTGIRENKYVSFTKKMVVESLFSRHSMHEKIFPFLLEINQDYIDAIVKKIPENPKVEVFHVKEQLQIEGNYLGALMYLSELDSFTSPRKTLQQLNKIKMEVCNDIDNYHQLFETGETYSIDGDNMLGIVCFMLCKLRAKLLAIFCQLQLLFVAYGDNLASVFESASYMVSTITAAFDYLASEDFC